LQFGKVNKPEMPYLPYLQHKDLIIERAEAWQMEKKPDRPEQLKFGHTFADHMMEVDWDVNDGWTRPMIMPLKELRLHPGAKVSTERNFIVMMMPSYLRYSIMPLNCLKA
jgi:hypothetical protein